MTWYTTSTSNLPLQIGVSESGFFPLLDAESYTQEQASRKGKEAKYGYHVPEQPEYVLSTVRDRLLIIDWGGGVEGFWLCKINDIPRYWQLIGSQFFNCPPLYSAGDNWSPLRSPQKNNVIPKSIFPHPFPSKDLKVAKSLTDCYGLIIQDWDCVTQSLQMW